MCVIWCCAGGRFVDWLQSWQRTHARAALAERLAWVYLAGVLVYNVLPLDLTISLVEIFHQWRGGKVNLIPFGRQPDDAAYALYEIATDALIWTPVALLWRLDGTRSAWRVWGMTLGTAVLLECMQLFVYSRVSDVTDLFTAAAGAALGVWIGGRLAAREAPASQAPPWSAWLPFALAAHGLLRLCLPRIASRVWLAWRLRCRWRPCSCTSGWPAKSTNTDGNFQPCSFC